MTSVEHHADPNVPGAYAVRATLEGAPESPIELLLSRGWGTTVEDAADAFEDVSFAQWPPSTGSLRFFT